MQLFCVTATEIKMKATRTPNHNLPCNKQNPIPSVLITSYNQAKIHCHTPFHGKKRLNPYTSLLKNKIHPRPPRLCAFLARPSPAAPVCRWASQSPSRISRRLGPWMGRWLVVFLSIFYAFLKKLTFHLGSFSREKSRIEITQLGTLLVCQLGTGGVE